jgi:hypothetical protein
MSGPLWAGVRGDHKNSFTERSKGHNEMAGDWIKMRSSLRSSPKVVRIASAFNADICPQGVRGRLAVVGALHAVWSLADEHSVDGRLEGYTLQTLDLEINWPGFSAAMQSVGWLNVDSQGIEVPRFDEHNGASAKRRAMESARKRNVRIQSGQTSASDADKKRTREEKRREEITTPLPPSGAFLKFWTAWPPHERKEAKGKCWEKWRKEDLDQCSEVILSHVESLKQSERWRGGFIVAPLVYLNQRRWEGAESTTAAVKYDA